MSFNGTASAADALVTLDSLGRISTAQTKQAPGSTKFDTVSRSYDVNGRSASVTMPCVVASIGQPCPSTPATSFQYDGLDRLFTATDGGTGTASYIYTGNDSKQTMGPPPTGENTKSRQTEYDGLGRLTSVCEILATGGSPCGQTGSASGYKTSYAYSVPAAGGSQMVVTQGSQTRTYVYDVLGRLISETNPESGTVTYSYAPYSFCWYAGQDGDLHTKTDQAGNVTCYNHDTLHRLIDVARWANNTWVIGSCQRLRYDTASSGVVTAPAGYSAANTQGRLIEAETDDCSAWPPTPITDEWFSYDARGQMTDVWQKTPNSGGYYHTSATYWANGLPKSLSGVPGLSGWTFGPDGEGRLSSVTYGTSTNWVTGTTYYPSNPQTTVTFGTGDTDVYGYDGNTGRMNSFQFNVGSTPKSLTGKPGWNPNGTLGSLAITDHFNPSNTQTCTYVHDDLSRIQSVSCMSGSTNVWGQNFSFDAYGNITKSVPSGSTGISFLSSYPTATNQFTLSACTVTYDANGNLTNDCANTYTWDAYGNMLSVNSTNLTYDAFGREVEIATGSVRTQVLYSPLGKLGLMNGQTAKTIRIPLPGGSTAELLGASGGTTHILHSDWLGSSRLSTAYGARALAYDVAYAPYGESYASSGSASVDLNFTGQSQDTASGLYDFLFRKYSPVQGRWLRPDPAGLAAVDPGNPQSWNRYAYVVNNPLALIDPLGLACHQIVDAEYEGGYLVTYSLYEVCDNTGGPQRTDGGDPGGSGGAANNGRTVHPRYEGVFSCNTDAQGLMQQVEGDFSQFANYQGSFSALGVPVSASASFSPGAVTQGGTINIQNVNSLGNYSPGQPAFFSEVNGVSVTVSSVSSTSFTFDTNPGHVLYPASITFSAANTGTGQVDFSIQVNGDFANLASNFLYNYAGGQQLENNIWNNFINNVQGTCNSGN